VAIPDYQTFMLPLLKSIADGNDHRLRDLVSGLGDQFGVTDQERAQLLPSGRATVLYSRVQWARAYLKQAGLVEGPARGVVRITEEGRRLLAENPPSVGLPLLMRYPSFVAFLHRKRSTDSPETSVEPAGEVSKETPEEALERLWQTLRDEVAAELLERLGSAAPVFFERLVVRLLVAMGYGGSYAEAASVVGRPGDEGIDGVIKEDRLGLDAVYVQAKRWQGIVGRPEIQKFAGSLEGARARKGVFITTSSFTPDAHSYVRGIEKKIVLIDGPMLADLMIDHKVGVTTAQTYVVPKVDQDYFAEE
jgi:restriction system protein